MRVVLSENVTLSEVLPGSSLDDLHATASYIGRSVQKLLQITKSNELKLPGKQERLYSPLPLYGTVGMIWPQMDEVDPSHSNSSVLTKIEQKKRPPVNEKSKAGSIEEEQQKQEVQIRNSIQPRADQSTLTSGGPEAMLPTSCFCPREIPTVQEVARPLAFVECRLAWFRYLQLSAKTRFPHLEGNFAICFSYENEQHASNGLYLESFTNVQSARLNNSHDQNQSAFQKNLFQLLAYIRPSNEALEKISQVLYKRQNRRGEQDAAIRADIQKLHEKISRLEGLLEHKEENEKALLTLCQEHETVNEGPHFGLTPSQKLSESQPTSEALRHEVKTLISQVKHLQEEADDLRKTSRTTSVKSSEDLKIKQDELEKAQQELSTVNSVHHIDAVSHAEVVNALQSQLKKAQEDISNTKSSSVRLEEELKAEHAVELQKVQEELSKTKSVAKTCSDKHKEAIKVQIVRIKNARKITEMREAKLKSVQEEMSALKASSEASSARPNGELRRRDGDVTELEEVISSSTPMNTSTTPIETSTSIPAPTAAFVDRTTTPAPVGNVLRKFRRHSRDDTSATFAPTPARVEVSRGSKRILEPDVDADLTNFAKHSKLGNPTEAPVQSTRNKRRLEASMDDDVDLITSATKLFKLSDLSDLLSANATTAVVNPRLQPEPQIIFHYAPGELRSQSTPVSSSISAATSGVEVIRFDEEDLDEVLTVVTHNSGVANLEEVAEAEEWEETVEQQSEEDDGEEEDSDEDEVLVFCPPSASSLQGYKERVEANQSSPMESQ
ncbi:Emm-like cell surface protein CspZ.2 [Planoprotostelium fungivorum]|uniref:Emm-like cell surface protein CspZ.2 n=1 Tax=Planoprotostelium fungivorum TaxID=1890364 RepID=A0A2P6NUG2_9EUKA|nr:Emm-like cell surface protein CspZ.2 [Planoprotostelium fungivorum]